MPCVRGVLAEVEPLASALSVPPSAVAGATTSSAKRKVRAPPRALALFLRDLLLEVGAGLEEPLWEAHGMGPNPEENDVMGRLEETPTGRASGCHSLTFLRPQ